MIDTARLDAALDAPLLAAAGTLPPIVWPNEDVAAPPLFLRVRRGGGMPYRSAINHLAKRGMLQIEVVGPAGQGEAPTKAIAQQVAALYPQDLRLDGYVRILVADILSGMATTDDAHWMTPVQVDWIVDFS